MAPPRFVALVAPWVFVAACGGEPSRAGLEEPIRVRNGVFREGELPGTPPSDAGTDVTPSGPALTPVETVGTILTRGQSAHAILGRASPTAWSVGVRFVGAGTGWWMVPVGGADPSFNNEVTWQLSTDLGYDLPTGLRAVRLVAIDASGRGGAQRDLRVCVVPPVPDNLHACDPSLAPPDTVVSLAWDNDADLDLVVVTPEGKVVSARQPTTALSDGGMVDRAALSDPSTGVLDRNAGAACSRDRIRRENLVWQGAPRPGVYRVYANLFDACRETAVRFRLSVWRRAEDGHPRETLRRDGMLGALAANGGGRLGTFVTDLALP